MERWEVKLIAMGVIFVIMEICGLLPIWVEKAMAKKGEKGKLIISVLTCFGGGVFFGAYLLHLAVDVRVILEESLMEPNDITYPVPELIIGFGFFLMLCMEKFVLYYSAKKAMKNAQMTPVQTTGHIAVVRAVNYDTYSHEKDHEELTPMGMTGHVAVVKLAGDHLTEGCDKEATKKDAHVSNGEVNVAFADLDDVIVVPNCCEAPSTGMPKESGKQSFTMTKASSAHAVSTKDPETGMVTEEKTGGEQQTETAQARSIALILALSLDCFFEGMALGLMTTNAAVLSMFVAIISHENVMAFCMGLELIKYYNTIKVAVGVTLYALVVPLGIGVGMIIYETQDETSTALDITNGVLTAIAAGCFIYVTFFGLLGEELRDDSSLAKLLAVIIGFLFMAAMALLPEGEETEEEELDDDVTTMMTTDVTTVVMRNVWRKLGAR